jgi:glycosyltransferase involved in cell wall biosynthesis
MSATSLDLPRSSRPLSICKVWDADYPWDIRVEKVSASLVAAGHTVHLVCRNAARRPRRETNGRFFIHRLPAIPSALGPAHAMWNFPHPASPVWAHAIWRVVRDVGADVILVRDLPVAVPAALIGRQLSVPVVLDMAEHYAAMLEDRLRYTPTGFLERLVRRPVFARLVEQLVLRLVDRVIVVVNESRDRLLKAGVAPDRLTVVSNTPRLDQWQASELLDAASASRYREDLCLVYLGNLDGSRGVDVVIRAVRALGERGRPVVLHVIGEGPSLEPLRALARNLDVPDRVHIYGRLPYARVRALMARADVGVIPHYATNAWNSTIPNKLFDYMLAGLPVVVSDARPTARIVGAEGCGEVFRDRDVEDLARCLLALGDQAVRREMGRRGHEAVQQRFHWGIDAQRLLHVVEAAARRGTPVTRSSTRAGGAMPIREK